MSTSRMPISELGAEESRRMAQHQSVRAQVEDDVQEEVAAKSRRPAPGEAPKVAAFAGELRERAVDDVVASDAELRRARFLARLSQVVDYGFYVIYALLGLRFVLALLAARSSAGFVKFIVAVTSGLYAPFEGIVKSPRLDGHTLVLPLVVAVVVYALLHAAINGLFRLIAQRKTAI
jgi:hypothetical protein